MNGKQDSIGDDWVALGHRGMDLVPSITKFWPHILSRNPVPKLAWHPPFAHKSSFFMQHAVFFVLII